MEVKKEIIVDKPISEVWGILGNQFGDAYKWARGLYHSESFGQPAVEDAHCSNRACNTSFGAIKEKINVFKPNQQLSYEVIEGFPGFIKSGLNNWYLTKLNDNRTKVHIHFLGETQGILGVIMKPMMKLNLSITIKDALQDFKFYVENGKPSPEKIKDIKKNKKKVKAVA
ncbi:SRPBCC family protein [Gilvibacter sediminis]|uniref:SRPBCC family protein n=1 Tax=Gilvibacter sediminis TaxID=379071 RepID=UPI00234FD032|nr:SRPBCC family protein [Gilvibacter sediminis]MDC7998390.1 SRPBCC family protein [Gilvibacter sediminis]